DWPCTGLPAASSTLTTIGLASTWATVPTCASPETTCTAVGTPLLGPVFESLWQAMRNAPNGRMRERNADVRMRDRCTIARGGRIRMLRGSGLRLFGRGRQEA